MNNKLVNEFIITLLLVYQSQFSCVVYFYTFFFIPWLTRLVINSRKFLVKLPQLEKKVSFVLAQLFHSLKLKTSKTATVLCLRHQQKIRLTKCFSQSRIPTSNKTKDYEISSSYTNGFLPLSHVRRNLFTYSNFSQILGQFHYYF